MSVKSTTVGLSLSEAVTVKMQGAEGSAAASGGRQTSPSAAGGSGGNGNDDGGAARGGRRSVGLESDDDEGGGPDGEEGGPGGGGAGQTADAFDGLFRGRQPARSRSRLGKSSGPAEDERSGRSASSLSIPDAAVLRRKSEDQVGAKIISQIMTATSALARHLFPRQSVDVLSIRCTQRQVHRC